VFKSLLTAKEATAVGVQSRVRKVRAVEGGMELIARGDSGAASGADRGVRGLLVGQ
jgi:hypothetical protein